MATPGELSLLTSGVDRPRQDQLDFPARPETINESVTFTQIRPPSSRIPGAPCGRLRCQPMSDVIDSDGFRANVGIVLMRGSGDTFLGRQVGGRGWQFPQGGVRPGESLEAAAYRELNEEIGLSRADVVMLGRTTRWLRYRLPARYVRRNQQPVCIGQKQRWFLMRLR